VYLFLRRKGHSPEDAQDLTQGFFADLIETQSYARAAREKGRFRSFLLGALKHFVADERKRDHAQKRGGGKVIESLDSAALEAIEAQVNATRATVPDSSYERAWAVALLRQTDERLAQECAMTGKSRLYELLGSYVTIEREEAVPYEELASRLSRSAVTLRTDLKRLRARYRAILREEVAGTVATAAEVDDELRYLCQLMAG
jgi:RNA polymerase sigma-70 factor (ECF subfamily)